MGEIKIQVTPSKPQSLQVGTRNVKNSVQITEDPTHYYSTLAKQWAVKMDGMVQDEDYSSKYWATQSKNSAEIAEASIETNSNLTELLNQNYQTYLNDLTDEHTQALSDITTQKNEALEKIETTAAEKITELNNLSDTAIDDITSAKTQAVEIIDNVKNVSVEEIEQEGTKQIDNIKQTGFYMKNGKLYYIDEDGKEVEFAGGGTALPLGTPVLMDHVLSYEESNGYALQGTYVYSTAIAGERYGYPTFVQRCLDEYNEATATTITIASTTINVKKHSNGHIYYDVSSEKSNADAIFNATGVADFYGIDEANQRVFMPRNNWFTQLTTDTSKVNEFVNAGLPNITGSHAGHENLASRYSGCFGDGGSQENSAATGSGDVLNYVNFDASRSSSIYGSSTTVQPKSSRKLLYYVVGNTVSDTAWVDVVTDVQGAVKDVVGEGDTQVARVEAAGNSFDNLTYRNVTNCITKIPQRIKYTLEDGNLTILAGSVFIVPYGTEDLTEEVTVGSNFITDALKVVDTQFANGKFFVWAELQANKNVPKPTSDWVGYAWFDVTVGGVTIGLTSNSGATGTAPISSATGNFYNTTDNFIYYTSTSGLQNKIMSFPFMKLTANTTEVQTIHNVFNGFGFVGSVVWVDKGVEALCPDGLNSSDGTYNSIEFKNQTLALYDNAGLKNAYRVLRMLSDGTFARSSRFHVDQFGHLIQTDSKLVLPPSFTFATIRTDTNAFITTFEPYGTFRATEVDGSISLPSLTCINLTLGETNTKYVMPGDGWLYLKKLSGANNTYAYFKTSFYEALASGATSGAYLVLFMPVTRGQEVTVQYTATGATTNFRFLYAMGGT